MPFPLATVSAVDPALAGIVGDPEQFFAEVWRRRPHVYTPAATNHTSSPGAVVPRVLTVTELHDVLACGLLREPYLEMVDNGRHIPAAKFTGARTVGLATAVTADREKVERLLAEGATLLLRNVEHWHTGTSHLTRELGQQLNRKVEAFFFLTPPERQALHPHRDDADVFVIQLQGTKRWTIHTPPADGRWEARLEPTPGPVALETDLTSGQVLYMPRGSAHCAVATGSAPSAHLSLTVREIGTAHLLTALQSALAQALDLPARPVDDEALEAAALALISHHRTALATISPRHLVQAARTALASQTSLPG